MKSDFTAKNQKTSTLLRAFLDQNAVLVIEPSPNYRVSLKQFLLNLRLKEVICVASFQEAREVLLNRTIGLILAEQFGMAEDGLDFCRELRANNRHDKVALLLMSSKGDRPSIIEAFEAGVQSYLLKPFSYDTFVDKLAKLVEQQLGQSIVQKRIEEGYQALGRKDVAEATHYFHDALLYAPTSAKARTGLAQCCDERGETDMAISHLKQALEHNEAYMEARHLLLRIYDKEQDYDNMLVEARFVCEQDIVDPQLCLLLANLYLRFSKFAEAKNFFKRSLSIRPQLAEAYRGLGEIALREKNNEEAVEMLEKALGLEQGDAKLFNALGLAYVRLRMYRQGIASYESALRLTPLDHRIYFNLGSAYERQCGYRQALDCYRRALDLEAYYPKARQALRRLSLPQVEQRPLTAENIFLTIASPA